MNMHGFQTQDGSGSEYRFRRAVKKTAPATPAPPSPQAAVPRQQTAAHGSQPATPTPKPVTTQPQPAAPRPQPVAPAPVYAPDFQEVQRLEERRRKRQAMEIKLVILVVTICTWAIVFAVNMPDPWGSILGFGTLIITIIAWRHEIWEWIKDWIDKQ